MDLAHYFAAFVILGVKILLYLQNIIKYFRKLFAVDKSFAIFARYSGMGDWIGPLNWTVGLDRWIGPLDWTIGLGRWIGPLDWTVELDRWIGFLSNLLASGSSLQIVEKGLPKRDCRKGIAEKGLPKRKNTSP
jgi:hypothetical protein